ncbi:hypothetical protein [Kitasatospora phosalacinea]|uniref:Uncharacterized protein n=1 Tax=Kitasatospora phosalacinea TaxID=2065 RepID=A0A9W6PPQ3_9ACTN|nr:hypothetical protein [Kitasatospora phosalacinea]GLW58653.1 hypothetical protein Kpho01_66640 [Kitasatospora phosalacinea]
MYDRPAFGRALPEVFAHVSRGEGPFAGLREVRAWRGAVQLHAILAPLVLAWALLSPAETEWARAALILGVLRMCRSTDIEWIRARRF